MCSTAMNGGVMATMRCDARSGWWSGRTGDLGEDAVDECSGVVCRELLGELDGFVDRDGGRDLVVVEDLPDGHPQHGPIDSRHPRQRPVLRESRDLLVDLVLVVDHTVDDLACVEPGSLA